MKLLVLFKKITEHKKFIFILLAVALLLPAPSLNSGFQGDDWIHRFLLLKRSPISQTNDISLYGLFSFTNGNISRNHAAMDKGLMPWWALEKLKVSFWRPLSELTHGFDYKLWPNNAVMMHIHNVLLFVLVILLLFTLYRKLQIPPWVAGLAALLYVIDDARAIPVSWLANRNAILAVFFGIATIIFHHRWRSENDRILMIAAPLVFILAMLSGESAIATTAYLFAYCLFIDSKTVKSRFLSLVPYGVVVVGWWFIYSSNNFGAFGSNAYIDPGSEPMRFFGNMVTNSPILLFIQFGFLPTILGGMLLQGSGVGLVVIISIIFIIAIVLLLLPVLKENKVARFLCIGMLLSVLPISSTSPGERLLWFVGIGGMGLLALMFEYWLDKSNITKLATLKRITFKLMLAILLFIHFIISPILFVFNSQSNSIMSKLLDSVYKSELWKPESDKQQTILVNGFFHWFNVSSMRIAEKKPLAKHVRLLSTGDEVTEFKRLSENQLLVTCKHGFFSTPMPKMLRSHAYPLKKGDVIKLTGFSAEIKKLHKSKQPLQVLYTFTNGINNYKFLQIEKNQLKIFSLPKVGTSIVLEKMKIL